MRSVLYVLLLLLFVSSSLMGQINRCSSDEYRQSLKERGLYRESTMNPVSSFSNQDNYTIPVVIHVLYNNDDQNISNDRIYSQIETLNNDYNALNPDLENVPSDFINVVGNVGLTFCLVQSDLNGNPFSGINRVFTNVNSFQGFSDDMKDSDQGGVDAWDTNNYLNIWVCNLSGNTLGFATMPGSVDQQLDGVVIDYEYFGVDLDSNSPYNLGRTATHEVGHYLNLEHTFYGSCNDLDGCDDTPDISSPTYGCPEVPQESCQSINMTMNYMDYANDACMYMFTICQAEKMIDALLTLRPNLATNSDCDVSLFDLNKSNIEVYPNPVSDLLFINTQNKMVLFFDIYGRNVLSKYIQNNSSIDVSSLHAGTYFVSINNQLHQVVKY